MNDHWKLKQTTTKDPKSLIRWNNLSSFPETQNDPERWSTTEKSKLKHNNGPEIMPTAHDIFVLVNLVSKLRYSTLTLTTPKHRRS